MGVLVKSPTIFSDFPILSYAPFYWRFSFFKWNLYRTIIPNNNSIIIHKHTQKTFRFFWPCGLKFPKLKNWRFSLECHNRLLKHDLHLAYVSDAVSNSVCLHVPHDSKAHTVHFCILRHESNVHDLWNTHDSKFRSSVHVLDASRYDSVSYWNLLDGVLEWPKTFFKVIVSYIFE